MSRQGVNQRTVFGASSLEKMKSSCEVFFYLFVSLHSVKKSLSGIVVTTEEGRVDGSVHTNRWGEVFFAFRKIPYAEPPVGLLRFKAPIPKRPWKEILDSSHFGPMCMQDDFWRGTIPISEDCLHLNVFTKSLPEFEKEYRELRPTIVFLHGGGFEAGSALDYGSEYLMEREGNLDFMLLIMKT
jgi:carboxylesterase type B